MSHYPAVTRHDLPVLNRITVSVDRVCAVLKFIRATKACGPDGISARIVHECATELSVPLAKLCNISLRLGLFPSKWKQANIVPIYRKGDKKTFELIDLYLFFHFLAVMEEMFVTSFCVTLSQCFPQHNRLPTWPILYVSPTLPPTFTPPGARSPTGARRTQYIRIFLRLSKVLIMIYSCLNSPSPVLAAKFLICSSRICREESRE